MYKRFKRGQVTIFIIIAIILVAIIILFFVFRQDKQKSFILETSSLKNFVESCLTSSLERVIFINSLQGGYYLVPEDSLIYNDYDFYFESKIPYYLIESKLLVPSKEDLENQISLGLEREFEDCLDFSEFPSKVTYDYESLEVDSQIINSFVEVDVKLPLVVKSEESAVILEDFNSKVDSNYFLLYSLAKQLSEDQSRDIDNLCLSCIVESAEEYGYNVSSQALISEDSYILINTLLDTERGMPFGFAYKFTLEEK